MKNQLLRLIKIVISIVIMAALFSRIDLDEFQVILSEIDPAVFAGVSVLSVVVVYINAIKWHVLLPDTSLKFLIYLCFRSQLYATILPGQLFGEVSKVTSWQGREDVMKVTASVFFDKITGMIGLLILAIVGLCFSGIGKQFGITYMFVILGIIFFLLIAASTERHFKKHLYKIFDFITNKNQKIGDKIRIFYDAWCYFSMDKVVLIKSVIWGTIKPFLGTVMAWYVSEMLMLNVGLIDYCWIMPAMVLILLLPVSFAGIGLRDASLVSMLSIYGVSSGRSLVISSILLMGQLLCAFIGGVMVMITNVKGSSDTNEHDER